ncbi:hypothetical protein HMPREF0765_4533 [Sphingobacterium spiritivorum ATCC 33300]|uniref:Uncharacterized protein n=1 Tax=Sphingobacterium spiritivorum ATCC 33300 TaxID=525372 RepID=C2G4M7_SPHSI|nr:hypothetical protein [Sphingobacterium spiritivorum]EEI89840.1 hypothetical protein HMPREF0765_4533 [Sphingobacterium spiritivorum ATCC 33300]QQS94829.1 hypothetical protein I6J03_15760 [Sphingobacterium spiritivorum]
MSIVIFKDQAFDTKKLVNITLKSEHLNFLAKLKRVDTAKLVYVHSNTEDGADVPAYLDNKYLAEVWEDNKFTGNVILINEENADIELYEK